MKLKRTLALLLVLASCLSLCACGGGSSIVDKVEVANNQYFMVFNSSYDFKHGLDDMPRSGIIVISNDGNHIHVYNGKGKETSNIDGKLWRSHAEKGTGNYLHYQSELLFVNDCLVECEDAIPYVAGQELQNNTWYIKRD